MDAGNLSYIALVMVCFLAFAGTLATVSKK